MLTEAPVLTQLESEKEFLIYSEAYLNGLGCVLMQEVKTAREKLFDTRFGTCRYRVCPENMVTLPIRRKMPHFHPS
ncbi:hypothetical protein EPI10_015846 [Gossypium australe]|uniref:Uncharacterized protein n=1 Tax=Gossypium australe TaxID=47621 RepID=A0A5B6VLK6_9ROSI|nr:hypothetical protein EPI10_015846 [Gossypium australe]